MPHHLYLETLTYAHVDDLACSLLSRIRFGWYSLFLFYDDIHRSNRKLSKNPRSTRSNSFSSESETEKQRKSSSGSEAESSSLSNALLVKSPLRGDRFFFLLGMFNIFILQDMNFLHQRHPIFFCGKYGS